jgi:hypothetical protein
VPNCGNRGSLYHLFIGGNQKSGHGLVRYEDGKELSTSGYDSIIAVFKIPENALRCTYKIQKEFLNLRNEKIRLMIILPLIWELV